MISIPGRPAVVENLQADSYAGPGRDSVYTMAGGISILDRVVEGIDYTDYTDWSPANLCNP